MFELERFVVVAAPENVTKISPSSYKSKRVRIENAPAYFHICFSLRAYSATATAT